MPRKGHTKSRRGCASCKARHLKCDERKPVCQRCSTSQRQCSFSTPNDEAFPENIEKTGPFKDTPTSNGLECSTSFLSYDIPHTLPAYTSAELTPSSMLHIELFYNFESHTCKTFTRTKEHNEIYCRTVLKRAFLVPYLMQAMLGLSALDLSLGTADRQQTYKHAAAALQSQALQSLESSQVLHNIDENNVLDLLLFQHLVAVHVFCDIFTSIESDFGDFMEKLVGCIHLLRGVNSVTSPWWHVLTGSELGIVMQTADAHQKSPHESRNECDPLLAMINHADLSTQSIEVCRASATSLQTYFDAENDLEDTPIDSTNMLFAWLVTASPGYASLLGQRRPEALVILAYYSVLLFRRRRNWAVTDAGEKLLQHVRTYLGKNWEEHLKWPIEEVLGQYSTLRT